MMKRIFFLLMIISIVAFGCTKDQAQRIESLEQENAALKALVAPPPSALDVLYPPKTDEPVFLFRMYGMATPFSGIAVDLFEEDFQNVKTNFEKFKTEYAEISKLVPEWEKDFPLGPVDELGEALESGDQDKVMAAMENLNQVCLDCHAANMAKVQYKYHWMDFRTIKVKDPLTDEEVDYIHFKRYVDASFVGIAIDLEQGQGENALKQAQGFKARFQALKDTCGECHGTEERKYYVDESIQALIKELEQALSGSTVDPEKVGSIALRIGMESCHKCHLSHGPAAMTKVQWKK